MEPLGKPMHKALFLDRDGVINVDKGYVHRIQDVEFLPGIFELCRSFQGQGYRLVVVTNQTAVARGMCSEAELQALHAWMQGEFGRRGVALDRIYYCPHHPEIGRHPYRQRCECRKPAPGMILTAERELSLELSSSVLIGDSERDIEAGISAGVGHTVRLLPDGGNGSTRASQRVRALAEILAPPPPT